MVFSLLIESQHTATAAEKNPKRLPSFKHNPRYDRNKIQSQIQPKTEKKIRNELSKENVNFRMKQK